MELSVVHKLSSFFAKYKNIHLLKNSLWNFIGQMIPLVAALVAIPVLIQNIGNERFGFLTIAWVLVGYFSLFDFGIGRAITYAVSKHTSTGERNNIEILSTALSFLFFISLLVSFCIFIFSGYIVREFMNLSEGIMPEAENSLKILSFSIPFVILNIGLRGALEGKQEFRLVNLSMIPFGVLLYIAPAIVSVYYLSLEYVISSLVIVRIFAFFILFIQCVRHFDNFLQWKFNKSTLVELLHFGGWMTVSNIVSPIMVNMDRLFIGSQLSMTAVTFYTVPYDLISKALVVPGAISGAMFPEFSRLSSLGEKQKIRSLFKKCIVSVFGLMILPLTVIFIFSHPLLSLWISEELATQSSGILKVLSVGVLINGFAYIPFAFLQGLGRSDMTAKFHIIEILIYVPLLFLLMNVFGLIGVAYAWVFRVSLDCGLLTIYSYKYLK